MRVASAWPQLGQPRSVRLHYVRGTALGQGALLPAGGNADPHDGMGVGGHLVGSSAPCFFSRAAAVAGSVLGNRSHDLAFGGFSGPVRVRILGTCTPQASASRPAKAVQTRSEAATRANLPSGISVPAVSAAGTALPRIDLLRMLLATGLR